MSDEPNPTAIAETTTTAASVGAEAAPPYLQAEALALKNRGILYIQEKPRQSVFIAVFVGMILGHFVVR